MYVGTSELAHIEYRNISVQKNCQPVQNPLILYYPHAYPPPILSHPMHALPLLCPTLSYPPPILSHPMHTLPLFYPTHACPPPILSHPCMPSLYSIPPHAYPPPCSNPAHAYPAPYSILAHAYTSHILSQLMHTLPLFYPSLYTLSPYSIPPHTCPPLILSHCMHVPSCSLPAHTCPPNSLSHEPGRHVSPLTSENAAFESAHLLSLSISSSFT